MVHSCRLYLISRTPNARPAPKPRALRALHAENVLEGVFASYIHMYITYITLEYYTCTHFGRARSSSSTQATLRRAKNCVAVRHILFGGAGDFRFYLYIYLGYVVVLYTLVYGYDMVRICTNLYMPCYYYTTTIYIYICSIDDMRRCAWHGFWRTLNPRDRVSLSLFLPQRTFIRARKEPICRHRCSVCFGYMVGGLPSTSVLALRGISTRATQCDTECSI